MYTVRTRSGTGRVPGRVLPRTGCVHGRVRDTDGQCAWPVYGRVHSLYTAEGGRAHSVHGRPTACNGRVHSAATAVYRVHGHVLCTWPCLRPVYTAAHSRVQTVYTAAFTACVHGIVLTVYTAVHGVYRSCRPACKGRVLYMVRPRPCTGYTYTVGYSVHGLVYGPCTRPLTAVYRLCTRPCTGHVHGPSVTRSRPCTRPVHGRVP